MDGRPEVRKEMNTQELKKVSDLHPKSQNQGSKNFNRPQTAKSLSEIHSGSWLCKNGFGLGDRATVHAQDVARDV